MGNIENTKLYAEITTLLKSARKKVIATVNQTMVISDKISETTSRKFNLSWSHYLYK